MSGLDAARLTKVLRNIPRPEAPDSLRMVRLVGNAWIGVFGDGAPAVFFELTPRESGTTRTVASGLELILSQRFEILGSRSARARTRSGYAVVLRNAAQIEIFTVVAAHMASRLRLQPSAFATQRDVDRYLADWIDLFRLQSLSPERAVGLWGELYILSVLPNTERGVACWVGPYRRPFDYTGNGVSLEVKTCLGTAVASFSLDQIEGRSVGHSVFVRVLQDDASGKSLDDLVAQIRAGLRDRVQFDATLAKTGFREGANAEMRLTAEDLQAIPNDKVPRPAIPDRRIRSVRYQVDIDALRSDFVPVKPLLRRLSGRLQAVGTGRVGPSRVA